MSRLSDLLCRLAGLRILLLLTLLYGAFLAVVMPGQAAASREYAGEWGAPDRQLFYTADEFYEQVGAWTAAGRAQYVRFRLGLDVAWAAVYTGWLVTALSLVVVRLWPAGDPRRLLNLTALLPGALDVLENALGIVLVLNAGLRLDPLVWPAAGVTAGKWLSLGAVHLLLVGSLATMGWRWWRARRDSNSRPSGS